MSDYPIAKNSRKERLLTNMRERKLIVGEYSRWGLPLPLDSTVVGTPQAIVDASPLQRRLIACAYATPSPGEDLCAAWVEQCFSLLGLGVVLGDAAMLYKNYCHHEDLNELKIGMIVAVAAHPYSMSGLMHGHVGYYIGDSTIMDCVNDEVRSVPVDLWLITYGLMSTPRWGWLGSIGLA